jgi:hypothetical protein
MNQNHRRWMAHPVSRWSAPWCLSDRVAMETGSTGLQIPGPETRDQNPLARATDAVQQAQVLAAAVGRFEVTLYGRI